MILRLHEEIRNGMNPQQNQQVQIGLARIYVKDLSFESPLAPQLFGRNWQPEVKMQVSVRPRRIQDTMWEVSLELSLEAKDGQKTGFMIEVEHSGLFEVVGASEAQLDHILTVFCPSTVFPYTRQVIDQLLVQGGFPPLMLAPINFEQLRKQGAQAPQEKQQPTQ
jgi:preprotein translocase subunit SecB